MLNIIYTPYTSNPQFELCWDNTPIAQYDASGFDPEEAEDVAIMLNYKIKAGEQLARRGWHIISPRHVPRHALPMYYNLWRYDL